MSILPKWKNPGRKRKLDISFKDNNFTKYYDLDLDDFTNIVVKLHNKEQLENEQNDRYAMYIYTIIYIVLENPKFSKKPYDEREELADQAIFELLNGLPTFNIEKGSSIYSYAYRICYTAFCHVYTKKAKDLAKQEAIIAHCLEELDEYIDSITDHKVKHINKEMK